MSNTGASYKKHELIQSQRLEFNRVRHMSSRL
jgi:hypothetical protein